MQKVCFLNGHLILRDHKTGVHYFHEKVTKKIAENNRGYDLVVGYFENAETRKAKEKEENKWILPFCRIQPNWMRWLSYMLPIELFFGRNDVYFCDGLFPISIQRAKRICLVHDCMVKIYPENYGAVKRIYLELFFSKLPKADLVVCVSETTKQDVIKYYNVKPEKIVVCYNGVDELKACNVEYDAISSVSLKSKYILYLGDMRPNKNLYNTINAFLTFCQENKVTDLFFYIAGKKNGEYSIIKELVENSDYRNQVIFLGYVDDKQKYALYDNCIGVVLLSKYEGFGMPIIEGMQHYKPIITSSVSSMKEIGEGTALFADPENITSIAKAIGTVYRGDFIVNKEEYDRKLSIYSFDNVAGIINAEIERLLVK